MQITFHRLDKELPIPQRAHDDDAAVDLHARVGVTIEPGERFSMPTGLVVEIPPGHGGLVLARSGLAIHSGVGVVNGPGLIDPGYRGEVSVILINHGVETVELSRGDRIAQLAVVPLPSVQWVEVEELSDTVRGRAGFGSSGA